MFLGIYIRQHEIGLWFRHGDFKGVLEPGRYWIPRRHFGLGDKVEVVDRLPASFQHELLDVLIEKPALAEKLVRVDLADDERALIWKDGRVGWLLGPGRHAFWREPAEIRVERYRTDDFAFSHPKLEAVLSVPGVSRFLVGLRVEPNTRKLMYRDGVFVGELRPGLHAYWLQTGRVTFEDVDLREQVADVAGQEIMTADKVTLRVNLVVTWRVVDPRRAVEASSDHAQALYREAQLTLRASVGGRSLDRLLADKDAVAGEVAEALRPRAEALGLEVRGLGLRDLILPGEMKAILNEVILAQKQSEANLIRRREETAAARSQANTAKLLAANPVLVRMRELDALREILQGAEVSFVFGSGDVADQIRSRVAKDGPS